MLDNDTDNNSIIQHSCALIAKASAFAGKCRKSRQIHAGSRGRIARRQERRSVSEIYTGDVKKQTSLLVSLVACLLLLLDLS